MVTSTERMNGQRPSIQHQSPRSSQVQLTMRILLGLATLIVVCTAVLVSINDRVDRAGVEPIGSRSVSIAEQEIVAPIRAEEGRAEVRAEHIDEEVGSGAAVTGSAKRSAGARELSARQKNRLVENYDFRKRMIERNLAAAVVESEHPDQEALRTASLHSIAVILDYYDREDTRTVDERLRDKRLLKGQPSGYITAGVGGARYQIDPNEFPEYATLHSHALGRAGKIARSELEHLAGAVSMRAGEALALLELVHESSK